ncbi:hypothetical protein BKA69DRAFT_1034025, partial [Paraphysoderma sedebokerense]
RVICYDNACNVLEYALNREPVFFKNTLCVIDGLHFFNHLNCNAGFDSRRYPELDQFITVLCEQKNNIIANIKKSALFFSSANFVTMMSYIIWRLNLDQHFRDIKFKY